MEYVNPFIKVNAGGIPRLAAKNATVNGDDVTFDFNRHRFLNYPYVGLIIFKLPAYTVTGSGNVYFTSGGGNAIQVLRKSGAAATSDNAALQAGGIFLGWYEDGQVRLFELLG